MGKVLLVAPVLPVDVLETVSILEKNDLLDCLVTRYSPNPKLARILAQSRFTKRFSKRPIAALSAAHKAESLRADLAYYFTRPLSRDGPRIFSFSIVDRICERPSSERTRSRAGVWEDSAMACRKASEAGVKKIYALPTAYWRTVRKLMRLEEGKFPGICRAERDAARHAERRHLAKGI